MNESALRREIVQKIRGELVCPCIEESTDTSSWHPGCRGAEYAARIVATFDRPPYCFHTGIEHRYETGFCPPEGPTPEEEG